ncbi:unnamed protein product [Lepeophtheirus salmonis]|uniref:(salmon louse) hypothetical protein n=1 Tax=Lepeophtheirus salmonis TaxID=72036 RepID=A0A7R8H9M6_LEPSM|nr:unnamed protein product [Lepeophtheirus salmonis]CAF2957354.1 unnamed protein product [Lepeophtheirus salmonis]
MRGVDNTLTVTEEFVELVPMMDTTTAEEIFVYVAAALGRAGVVTEFKAKVQVRNGGDRFLAFHCIFNQEALCCKSLKIDPVMEVVVRTVNFIRARVLSHRHFETFLR